MSKYDEDRVGAAADVAEAGTTCTLTLGVPQPRHPLTDALTGDAPTVVTDHPVVVLSVGQRDAVYFPDGLIVQRQRRFLMGALGLPRAPRPGDRLAVTGDTKTFALTAVKTLEPDGAPIIHIAWGQT